jgi:hypothetical protein
MQLSNQNNFGDQAEVKPFDFSAMDPAQSSGEQADEAAVSVLLPVPIRTVLAQCTGWSALAWAFSGSAVVMAIFVAAIFDGSLRGGPPVYEDDIAAGIVYGIACGCFFGSCIGAVLGLIAGGLVARETRRYFTPLRDVACYRRIVSAQCVAVFMTAAFWLGRHVLPLRELAWAEPVLFITGGIAGAAGLWVGRRLVRWYEAYDADGKFATPGLRAGGSMDAGTRNNEPDSQ